VIRPETQAYVQKLEQEKIEKAKGQQADNRGFFAKYVSWLVFLDVITLSNSMLTKKSKRSEACV